MAVYDFSGNHVPGVRDREEPAYWRDVGTLEAHAAGAARRPGPATAIQSLEPPVADPRRRAIGAADENPGLEAAAENQRHGRSGGKSLFSD
jgi:hypothetical protein